MIDHEVVFVTDTIEFLLFMTFIFLILIRNNSFVGIGMAHSPMEQPNTPFFIPYEIRIESFHSHPDSFNPNVALTVPTNVVVCQAEILCFVWVGGEVGGGGL